VINNPIEPYCDYNFSLRRELTEPGGAIYESLPLFEQQRLQLFFELVDEEQGRIYAESNLLMLLGLTVAIVDIFFTLFA
jgi:hypothetical protein